jgi:hypothetical protein
VTRDEFRARSIAQACKSCATRRAPKSLVAALLPKLSSLVIMFCGDSFFVGRKLAREPGAGFLRPAVPVDRRPRRPGETMSALLDNPLALFILSLIGLWLIAFVGYYCQRIWRPLRNEEQDEFKSVLGASLTLLGLIVGFSFAMSVNRYDMRKSLEESEANAVGTEFVRADLLPAPAAIALKDKLKAYLDRRIAFYSEQNPATLVGIERETATLQSDIWAIVRDAAAAQPSPIVALTVAGANDAINAQGYVLAAWHNRIPIAAWGLMALIASACSGLLGFGGHRFNAFLLLVVPATISISFLLIAEIDSPRGGFIRVLPINLVTVAESFKAP